MWSQSVGKAQPGTAKGCIKAGEWGCGSLVDKGGGWAEGVGGEQDLGGWVGGGSAL